MKYYFDSCEGAIQNAITGKQFGMYYSKANHTNTDIHTHNTCELLFCITGGETFLIADKLYEVNDGDLFVINQFEAHKITNDPSAKRYERFVVEINPEFLHSCSTEETDLSRCFYSRTSDTSHRISLSPKQARMLYKLFSRIKNDNCFGADVLNQSALIQILVHVNNMFSENHSQESEDSDASSNELILKIMAYINSNYNKDNSLLSLEAISKNTFVSHNQLCRIFKEYTGTTVSKYILSRKISEAKKLLARGESVAKTAEACGFSNYANFIRVFKKSVGIPPGKYAEKK